MTADASITREEARTIGARRYLGGPCQRGHEGWRYTKGSACIECVRIARGGWLKTRKRSAANMVLTLEAQDNGRTTYNATRPCRLGHTLRFVASNNCVECGKITLERQKIARKFARIRSIYGLSREDYLAMVASQDSACRICRRHESDHFKLHIDHCHATGKVRGLLCGPCNQSIGLLQHSPERLAVAINYLKETRP